MKIEPSDTNAALGAELENAALGRRSLLERHQAALLDLAKLELQPDDTDLPFRILTEVSARTLFVERVGVWVFDPARTKIVCLDLFEASTVSGFLSDWTSLLERAASGPQQRLQDLVAES